MLEDGLQEPNRELPYSDEELFGLSPPRTYRGEHLNEVAPRLSPDDFRCCFSVDPAWGSIHQQRDGNTVTLTLAPVEGVLRIEEVYVGGVSASQVEAKLAEDIIAATWDTRKGGVEVILAKAAESSAGGTLMLTLTS